MPLNSSGPLSLGGATLGESVNLELSKSATAIVSLNDTDLRTLFGVGSGQISLSQGYGKSSWTNAATRGYWGGGFTPFEATNTYDRFTFATETMDRIGATLTAARSAITCANNTQKGYILGSQTEGLDFAAESLIDPAASVASYENHEGTNSAGAGFSAAGSAGGVHQKFTFGTESYSATGASMVQPRTGAAGVMSQTRGYYCGGTDATPQGTAQIDGILFSTESQIDPGAGLAQGRNSAKGVNSATRGYFGGGRNEPFGTSQIDGIDFAGEFTIDPGAGLVQGRVGHTGMNSATRGYWGGGTFGPSRSTQIDGINFAGEFTIDPGAEIEPALGGKGSMSSFQNSNN
jgi:hypothetical protein